MQHRDGELWHGGFQSHLAFSVPWDHVEDAYKGLFYISAWVSAQGAKVCLHHEHLAVLRTEHATNTQAVIPRCFPSSGLLHYDLLEGDGLSTVWLAS